MGLSKGSGYSQQQAVTPEVASYLKSLLPQAQQNQQVASEAYKQFLPGGTAAQGLVDQANKNFKQQTIPSIMGAFGTNNKGSSTLNQALASGAADLNTNIANMLSGLQFNAASGLSNIGANQSGIGSQTQQIALTPNQMPFWQQAILAGIGPAGQFGSSYFGR